MNEQLNDDMEFIITVIGPTRVADYQFYCCDSSVFIDFDDCYEDRLIRLVRISFDSYGCCKLDDNVIPMNETDSQFFRDLTTTSTPDQSLLRTIIKKNLSANRKFIWEDALNKYGLI